MNMNLKRIIKSELLFESLEDRLKSAYVKWCKKMKLKDQNTLDDIKNADGYVEELDVYAEEFEDPYSKMYQKVEELYAKEDYEGIHNLIADHQCKDLYIGAVFKDWLSYRNLTKSSDIFQYKSERELAGELWAAKEKSFTKKLKKASAGEDFDKIWENDDMLIVVPKSHVGACKFGQGTKWCTASKQNDYFDSYYKKGILYRVLQKNDNYKESFSNLEGINKRPNYDIENLSKTSLNLIRKQNSMSMVDKVDNMFGDKVTSEFLNSLPSEGYKAIKNYQSLNEQNIKTIIREEINDFDWVGDSPEEITLKWMDDNLLKCVDGNRVRIISKEKPESHGFISMLEKDHPGIDKESWYNVIGIFFKDPKLGEFVDCDDYIKEKRNKINFDNVKEFLMSKFSIINEDDSLSLNMYYETDGFIGDDIHITNIPITGFHSKSDYGQNKLLGLSNLLQNQFGVNLIDKVTEWISNITEEELQDWLGRPQYIVPFESNLRV